MLLCELPVLKELNIFKGAPLKLYRPWFNFSVSVRKGLVGVHLDVCAVGWDNAEGSVSCVALCPREGGRPTRRSPTRRTP